MMAIPFALMALSAYESNKTSDTNAAIAQQQGQQEQQKAEFAAYEQTIANLRQKGAIRASYAASGVADTGTELDVLADQYMSGARAVKMDLLGGMQAQAYYQNEAANFQQQGNAAIVSDASRAFSMYQGMNG